MNKKRQNQAKKLLEDINKYKPEVEKVLFDGEKESSMEVPMYWYCCLLLVMKRMRPNLDEETFWECIETVGNEINNDYNVLIGEHSEKR